MRRAMSLPFSKQQRLVCFFPRGGLIVRRGSLVAGRGFATRPAGESAHEEAFFEEPTLAPVLGDLKGRLRSLTERDIFPEEYDDDDEEEREEEKPVEIFVEMDPESWSDPQRRRVTFDTQKELDEYVGRCNFGVLQRDGTCVMQLSDLEAGGVYSFTGLPRNSPLRMVAEKLDEIIRSERSKADYMCSHQLKELTGEEALFLGHDVKIFDDDGKHVGDVESLFRAGSTHFLLERSLVTKLHQGARKEAVLQQLSKTLESYKQTSLPRGHTAFSVIYAEKFAIGQDVIDDAHAGGAYMLLNTGLKLYSPIPDQ